MSKILRFVFLTSVLCLMLLFLPSAPAHASFNAICYITSGTLPPIRMQADEDGGVTFYVETANGQGRFFQIRPAGGHWEISSMHTLPEDTALELDSEGYPIVHQN
ncbi:MAG TPA: hypothetical protein VLB76_20185 [Thermoanaerobaculia bacterium]|jgi:hypothetical protein|nr:hypothetical protein [Thermoanaerobaculia bacterium]